jgi:hypothetical protein
VEGGRICFLSIQKWKSVQMSRGRFSPEERQLPSCWIEFKIPLLLLRTYEKGKSRLKAD